MIVSPDFSSGSAAGKCDPSFSPHQLIIVINIVTIRVIVIMITTPTSAIKSIDDYATLAIPIPFLSVYSSAI